MDYSHSHSHFHFPMSDSAYPVINGYYPPPHAPGHGHRPSDFSNASSEFLPQGPYPPRDDFGDLFDDGEDGDAESKTRLSPEQMAELEREFRMNHKPKTERKKVIAQRLRLQLPRVNNWYQNRRAKAKHQRPSTQEFDVSSNDDTVTSPERGFSTVTSVSQAPKSEPFYHRPTDSGVDFPPAFDLGFEGFDFGLDAASGPLDHVHQEANLPNSGYSSAMSSAITPQHGAGVQPMWPNDDFSAPARRPFANVPAVRDGSSNHSPQSSNGVPAYEGGLDQARKANFDPSAIHMYHDLLTDHLSTQDLNNASSDAAFLMTPPTDTPTLPWMADELHSRRTSDSSELAHNFASNLHVQQSGAGLAVSTATISPSTVFQSSLSTPPVLTPDISPDQATAKSTSGFDIASRRKVQRPEPLVRPSAERSHSYGGPPTMSPRQRVPSHGLKSSKSSNVLSGRVSKPGSAQASPRHFQTQFEVRRPSAIPTCGGRDESVSAISVGNINSFAQVSPATSAHSASGYWEASGAPAPALYGNPNAYSSVPDLSVAVPEPHAFQNFAQPTPNRPRQSQPSDFDAPQSAPSHQSTFNIPESPSIHGEAFNGQNWPVSQYPSGFNLVAPQMPAARPNGHTAAHSFGGSGYQPPFAPKVHPGFLAGQSFFPAWSQHPMGYAQSPAQPERDFKVELETKPDQIFVKTSANEFNFANITPKDYDSQGGKKK